MNQGFTPEFLEELKYKCDIVEIISQYVPLQKKGGRYFGCCPFHNEKTGSFCVNQNEGYYHCFGCGASGDVIKFISERESIDFFDAVKLLADKVGLPMPEVKFDPAYEQKKERKETLRQLMRDAARFYRNTLLDPVKGADARAYLQNRGIDENTQKRYGLGLSPGYEELPNYLRRKGYKIDDLFDVGLIMNKERLSDAFANRVIVPIFNSMDEVIAFGGRIYRGEQDVAKYKNSTNTVLFDKGRTTYGISHIKADRRQGEQEPYLILVEGYMDVISLGAAGIKNAIACMGTALTDGQARELKRLCPTIYVCYDGDEAGRKATLRNIDILKRAGLDVLVASLDDGKDPDETVRQDGVEAFRKKLEEAVPVTEYKLRRCEEAFDLGTVDGRSKYLARAMEILRQAEFAEQTMYLPYINARLGGKWSVEALQERLKEQLAGAPAQRESVRQKAEADPKLVRAARVAMYCILKNKPFADINKIDDAWFNDPEHKKMLSYARSMPAGTLKIGSMLSYFEDEGELKEVLAVEEKEFAGRPEDAQKAIYRSSLMALADAYLTLRIDELKKQTRVAGGTEFRVATATLAKLLPKLKSKNLEDKLNT